MHHQYIFFLFIRTYIFRSFHLTVASVLDFKEVVIYYIRPRYNFIIRHAVPKLVLYVKKTIKSCAEMSFFGIFFKNSP
jgi:hypothetical protein